MPPIGFSCALKGSCCQQRGPAARTSATIAPQFQSSSNTASTPGPTRPRIGRPCARGPYNPHMGPMTCAWAASPRRMFRGLRAYQGVNAHIQGFAYKRHSTTDTTAPKTQTTSPTTPRLSAFFAEVVCTLGTTPPHVAASPPPKGGNGGIRDPTRRRHADSQPLMLQNPHRHWHGGRRRDRRARAPRHPWAAGPGRASKRRAERSSRRGRLAGGPPPTGTHSGRGLRRPQHPWGHSNT